MYQYQRYTNSSHWRQLLYVPIHKTSVTASFTKKQWHVMATVSYLGKRFDTTDNFQSLHPAVTGLLKQNIDLI